MRIIAGIVVAALLVPAAFAGPMTAGERERLVAHLQMTASWIQDETSHLSKAQLEYHAAPDKWSVIDVLEHLNLAEPIYWKQFQDAMKTAPAGKKSAATDADILWYGIDREQHQMTSPNKIPEKHTPGSADVRARLEAFRKLHAEMLDYARGTNEELRAHILEGEGIDLYQWLLMISTHAQRHILQIREVKASAGFPKG
jgi:DinB superfamily